MTVEAYRRHGEIERHEPLAPVTVEQRSGDRAQHQSRKDEQEEAHTRRRSASDIAAAQRDQTDGPHLRRGAGEQRADQQPSKSRNTQQSAVGRGLAVARGAAVRSTFDGTATSIAPYGRAETSERKPRSRHYQLPAKRCGRRGGVSGVVCLIEHADLGQLRSMGAYWFRRGRGSCECESSPGLVKPGKIYVRITHPSPSLRK